MRFGRNDECPCGSGRKYKKCCHGRVSWEEMYQTRDPSIPTHPTLRGKNLAFLSVIGDALQLDNLDRSSTWKDIKRACTPAAIRKIHEAVPGLWPDEEDLLRVLDGDKGRCSGLYVGVYEPEAILRGVTRHALYSDRLLLFDPFLDPRRIRPDFNPVENPERHRMNTLRCLRLWMELVPWIGAGLLGFIRSPEDFNHELYKEGMRVQKEKVEKNPDLARALEESLPDDDSDEVLDLKRLEVLSRTDADIVARYVEDHPTADQREIELLMRSVGAMRDEHPYYVHGASPRDTGVGELLMQSTGTNYYIAKLVAGATGAHLITDIPSRWKEVEMDRGAIGAELGGWTPFSKAFQNVSFKFLNNVPLAAALHLRKQDRFDNMRSFLRRVWKESRADDELSEGNAQALADELLHHINEADDEWRKINADVVKWWTGSSAGILAATPGVIAQGGGAWLAGGWALSCAGMYGMAWSQRRRFYKRYPAAFFLSLRDRSELA